MLRYFVNKSKFSIPNFKIERTHSSFFQSEAVERRIIRIGIKSLDSVGLLNLESTLVKVYEIFKI